MKLALIINRAAGAFRSLNAEAVLGSLIEVLSGYGHHLEGRVVDRRELASTLSSLAGRSDLDGVVVGGGDGTILTAIVAGLGHSKPLGILPLGTLNLFARDLRLPEDPFEAARALSTGKTAAIDLAEVNGLPFAIWASLGMHPWLVRRRDHLQRDGMRKWRAVILAALRAIRRYPMIQVTLDMPDGAMVSVTTPMLFITNNPWREEPLPLSRQTLDSGLLEINVAHCRGRLSLLWLMLEAALGHWRASKRLATYRVREVRVTSRKHRVMVSLDGEVTVLASPLVFKARPKALRIIMPDGGGA